MNFTEIIVRIIKIMLDIIFKTDTLIKVKSLIFKTAIIKNPQTNIINNDK